MNLIKFARVAKQVVKKTVFGGTALLIGLSGLATAAPLLFSQPVLADSLSQTANPTAAASVGTSGTGWTSTNNALAVDGTNASTNTALPAGSSSKFLELTGFNFSIPTGATITAIKADITHRSPSNLVTDNVIQLIGGTGTSTNMASGAGWPVALADQTYGSDTELWGESWTPSQVDASSFGIDISAQNTDSSTSHSVYVDGATITVYYTPAADPVYYVDALTGSDTNDGSSGHPFKTIGAAVNAANSGDTINVAAGDYTGEGAISVSKNITINGAQVGVDARTRSGASESTVAAFNVSSANVTIDGFTFNPGSATNQGIALTFHNGSAETIKNNILKNYGFDASYYNATGSVDSNCNATHGPLTGHGTEGISFAGTSGVLFQQNLLTSPTATGEVQFCSPAAQDGLFFGSGTSNNIQILSNTFNSASTYPGTDVGLSYTSGSNPIISGNSSTGGATLVTLFNSTGGQITNNNADTDPNISGSGIYIGGGDSNTTVSGNTIHNFFYGVALRNVYGDGPSTATTITNNDLSNNSESGGGISARGTAINNTETVVSHQNDLSSNTTGVENTTAGTIDASNNYWGTAVASTIASSLVSGSGVTSTPYYVDSGLTTLNTTTPTTVYVGTSYADGSAGGHAFGYNAFTTIQAGLNAVAANGTVNVAAGTYNENVTVSKNGVTLSGAQAGVDARTRTAATDPAVESIINGTSPVALMANNVTVNGFTIQGSDSSDKIAGIWDNPGFSGTHGGAQILNNVIQNNVIGIGIGNDGSSQALIQFNLIRDNNNPGPSSGSAISTDFGLKNGVIDSNLFDNNQVSLNGFGTSGVQTVTLSNNEVANTTSFGVFLLGTSDITISGNNIHDNDGGISIDGQNDSLSISGNILKNNSEQGIDVANDYASYGVLPNTNITIHHNDIEANTLDGIAVDAGAYSGTVDATQNWWGSNVLATVLSKASGDVSVAPYYSDSGFSSLSQPSTVYVDPSFNSSSAGGHVFGYDAFTTIQAGVNAAAANGTVNVVTGTYNENVTVPSSLTLNGAGSATSGTVIQPASGNAITITGSGTSAASPLTIKNLRATTSGGYGVYFNSISSHVALNNVAAVNNTYGIEVHNSAILNDLVLSNVTATGNSIGFRVATTGSVNGLTVSNSSFDNNSAEGFYVNANSASTTNQNDFTNISVTNTTFNNDILKGFYAEKLDHATFDGITVNNSGTSGASSSGFNVNEKYGAYQNITIQNSTVTSSGTGDVVNGTGINIEARDDAPSYNTNPATLSGVTISNDTITGNQVGLRFGETGKNNAGPTNVTMSSNTINGNLTSGVNNQTLATINASLNYWGSAAPDFSSILSGANVSNDPWFTNAAMTTRSDAKVVPDDSGNATANNTTPQVIVTDSTQPVNVTVSNGTTNATVDYSSLVTSGSGIIPQTTITTADAVVSIPASTTVTASDTSWDGVITAPTVQSNTSVTVPAPTGSTTTVGTVIEVGAGNISLTFDNAVRLLIPGQAGQLVGFVRNGDFTQISNVCSADDQAIEDAALAAGADCYINVGSDLVVWTKHFTTFVTYSQAPTPSSTSSNTSSSSLSSSTKKATTTSASTNRNNANSGSGASTPAVLGSNSGGQIGSAATTSNTGETKAATTASPANASKWYWWAVGAAIIVIAGAGYYIYRVVDTDKKSKA